MPDTYGVGFYGTAVYSSVVVTPPANTVAPAVTGSVLVGSVLSCTTGTWTDSGHISYGYQWQRSADGATGWGNIASATNSTYTLAAADAFKFVKCVVTDTDANGATATSSNVVGSVAWPLPVNTAAPVISGTPQVGLILSATSGTWTDDGSPVITYQWQDSPDGATGWGNISTTGQIYFIEPSRQSEYLRCVVTNTDAGGATQAISNSLGPVTPATIVGLSLVVFNKGTLTLIPVTPFP